jgi:predicted transcriptional regulator
MTAIRRTQIHIYIDILKLIKRRGGIAKPTQILYGANLSHVRLKKHMALMEEQNFVEKHKYGNSSIYKITKKGHEFMKEFKKIEEFSEAFGVPV